MVWTKCAVGRVPGAGVPGAGRGGFYKFFIKKKKGKTIWVSFCYKRWTGGGAARSPGGRDLGVKKDGARDCQNFKIMPKIMRHDFLRVLQL
jgi:hypothetical protein